MQYVNEMRKTATQLGESEDRITLEPLSILQETTYRHATIALAADGCIHYWDTMALFTWINSNPTHPWSRRPLAAHEIAYITHYHLCLTLEQARLINEEDICKRFIAAEGHLEEEERLVARATLSPRNFADHFQDYPPLPEILRYERAQAKYGLDKSVIGVWLLRYSAFNRPLEISNQQLLSKLGLKYYVLSYNKANDNNDNNDVTVKQIHHILILHRPGHGWAHISDVRYANNTVIPVYYEEKYYLCFVDILLKIIQSTNLKFANHLSGYA
ncbi:hypothetical protein LCGC14_2215580 [marine sediment metagenome]|uniref:Uncharacterized protein n=2 Tax=root TaxID=1 RepID=A0A0F9G864_9ZZZZ|nr:MAG: hypothetical protein LCMAC202_04860 [Marseillevirus LCMAC202]